MDVFAFDKTRPKLRDVLEAGKTKKHRSNQRRKLHQVEEDDGGDFTALVGVDKILCSPKSSIKL
jgi:hypothetical protein